MQIFGQRVGGHVHHIRSVGLEIVNGLLPDVLPSVQIAVQRPYEFHSTNHVQPLKDAVQFVVPARFHAHAQPAKFNFRISHPVQPENSLQMSEFDDRLSVGTFRQFLQHVDRLEKFDTKLSNVTSKMTLLYLRRG